jgi:uncharacterized protein YecE (DUF72 family)
MQAIRIGTSGWSYDDWVGPFYAPRTPPAEFLGCYARQFDVVEVDSTFYRPPSAALVAGWAARTPEHFRFAVKMPQRITHEKVLCDCDAELEDFAATLGGLGPKLKSVLLQFGYFNRATFSGPRPFLARLESFFAKYAARLPLACEIRNRTWLGPDYFGLLREHRVATALVEHAWLPPIEHVIEQHDVATAPYVYVRLIGDRAGIEQVTTTWERVVIDRAADLRRVAAALRRIAASAELLVFVNNHYAGHGPQTCRDLARQLEAAQ